MTAKNMNIILNGIRIFAYHGVLPQENQVGAMYTINLKLSTDFTEASLTDNLSHTINYAEVYQVIQSEMKHSSKLLEHVVYRISQKLFTVFPSIEAINIALFKENPPMGADCQNIGVEATYNRD